MLSRISIRLRTWAKGWVILLVLFSFILLIVVSTAFLEPLMDPALVGAVSLDAPSFLTPEQAYAAVDSFGDVGRTQSAWFHMTWDFIVPVVYTLFFCLLISWLFMRGFKLESNLQQLNLFPIVGGAFDIMENIWITTMIVVYPAQPAVVAWLRAINTLGKYFSGVVIIALLLIGLVKAAMNGFKLQQAVTSSR